MNRTFLKTLILALPVFFLSSQAAADIGMSIVFSSGEISIIRTWYRRHRTTAERGQGEGKPKGGASGWGQRRGGGRRCPHGVARRPKGKAQRLAAGDGSEPGPRQTSASRLRQAVSTGGAAERVAESARRVRAHHR